MKKILVLTAVIAAGLFCNCNRNPFGNHKIPFYIGTYTMSGSEGIYHAVLDTLSGEISGLRTVAHLQNPSYLAIDQVNKLLFAVSENDGTGYSLFSFRIDPKTGDLTIADSTGVGWYASCYVSVAEEGLLAVANYMSGDVAFVRYSHETGTFSSDMALFKHSGKGTDTVRQEAPHAHSAVPDPDGRFVYAADLGTDQVVVYEALADKIRPAGVIKVRPGAGPRHLDFSPDGSRMALLTELDHSIMIFKADRDSTFSIPVTTLMLEPDTTKANTSADIHYSPDGRFLYASVRGDDQVVVVRLADDKAEIVERYREGIIWPRNFAIAPSSNFLLVANRNGNNIVVLKRDIHEGTLQSTGYTVDIASPVCIKFYSLKH